MCINYMKGENKEADYNTRHFVEYFWVDMEQLQNT